jgi:hypothetical protein
MTNCWRSEGSFVVSSPWTARLWKSFETSESNCMIFVVCVNGQRSDLVIKTKKKLCETRNRLRNRNCSATQFFFNINFVFLLIFSSNYEIMWFENYCWWKMNALSKLLYSALIRDQYFLHLWKKIQIIYDIKYRNFVSDLRRWYLLCVPIPVAAWSKA